MKKIFMFMSVSIAILTSCSNEDSLFINVDTNESGTTSAEVPDSNFYVPGVSIVRFSDKMLDLIETDLNAGKLVTRSMGLNSVLDEIGVTSIKRLFPFAGEYEPRTRKEGLHRWYVIEYSKNVTRTRADNNLKSIPGVEYIEGQRIIAARNFNDPFFADQWGLANNGIDINVQKVWKYYTTGDPSVIVSVVDEGFDLSHEDLEFNTSSLFYDSVSDSADISKLSIGDHGCHVAGIIAAVNNNEKGICGIAGGDHSKNSQGVSLMSNQIFKKYQDFTLQGNTAEAIKWGADHGAIISQNSWGYNYDWWNDGIWHDWEIRDQLYGEISESDKAAVDYFIKYAGCDNDGNQLPNSPMKGGVVIFAAGNEKLANGVPANYDKVIAVGAIDKNGERASYSNFGDFVDLAAPGSDIYSCYASSQYGLMSGTSMACPHVSGVVALVVSYCGGPGFTNEMLKEALLKGANYKITEDQEVGGLVDALGAITYCAKDAPGKVTDLSGSCVRDTAKLVWTITGDKSNFPASGFLVLYGNDKDLVEKASPENHDSVLLLDVPNNDPVGTSFTANVPSLKFQSKYYFKIIGYSYKKFYYSEPSNIISIETVENNPPIIKVNYNEPFVFKGWEAVQVPIEIFDPDGDKVTVSYQQGSSADSFKGNFIAVNAILVDQGTYQGTLYVNDEFGGESKFIFRYSILENNPPRCQKGINDIILRSIGEEKIFDLNEYFSDPDGEDLTYSASFSNNAVAITNFQNNKMTLTSIGQGRTDITIQARDHKGETAKISLRLAVQEKEFVMYPTTVKDSLKVIVAEESIPVKVSIYSQTGSEVLKKTVNASAFEPAVIDVSKLAPGRYNVKLSSNSKNFVHQIFKK